MIPEFVLGSLNRQIEDERRELADLMDNLGYVPEDYRIIESIKMDDHRFIEVILSIQFTKGNPTP